MEIGEGSPFKKHEYMILHLTVTRFWPPWIVKVYIHICIYIWLIYIQVYTYVYIYLFTYSYSIFIYIYVLWQLHLHLQIFLPYNPICLPVENSQSWYSKIDAMHESIPCRERALQIVSSLDVLVFSTLLQTNMIEKNTGFWTNCL